MITKRRVLPATLLCAILLADASLVAAQGPGATYPVEQVEQVGVSDAALDLRLSRLLAERPPALLVLAGDSLIGATDTVAATVLVLDATLILEGTITGDLVLVDAGAFVRPGSRVGGDLVNIAGGLYRSTEAGVGGRITDLPEAYYRVLREVDRIVIEAFEAPQRLILDGLAGVRGPTYDRVNGLTAAWGGGYRFPALGPIQPTVRGHVGWRTQLGEPMYGTSVAVRLRTLDVEGGYERGSVTNDDWIRRDLTNSLNYLWNGRDYRDYNQAERFWTGLRQTFGDEQKSLFGVLSVRGRVEDAESLPGGEPWHLFGDSTRANPAIDDGRTTSVVAGLQLDWHGLDTWFEGSVEYEAARKWMDGDFKFDRLALTGEWAMRALADHTLAVRFFVQAPLKGTLPFQRWSYVGGPGTLQTVEFARYQGDRIVFVETRYAIPAPRRFHVPILGTPTVEAVHATGMAWTEEQNRSFRQEVGLRLRFFILELRYMLDPAEPSTGDLDAALRVSLGSPYGWQ